MAKFFNILAASVGSGLVLGASIRLGEALGSKLQAGMPEPAGNEPQPLRTSPPVRDSQPLRASQPGGSRYTNPVSPAFLNRLDQLEEKMSRAFSRFEGTATVNAEPAPELQTSELQTIIAGVVARMDRQQSDVESIRHQVSKATRTMDSVGDIANRLRGDLQKELSRDLDERLAAMEARVHVRIKGAHGETLDAMVSAMENRVTPRIVRMESEIAAQTAAVSELRECALQSERSIQRLIGVLERVMNPAQTDSGPPMPGGAPQSGQERQPGNDPSPVAGTLFDAGREAAPAGTPVRMPPSFAVFNPIS
jgi:Skp family chaperone for outer membrane proteins